MASIEFTDAINIYNNLSTSSLNHVFWSYLKETIKNDKYCFNIVNITNTCISYWPTHFKKLSSIIIPKPNKLLYNSPKSFYLIVLLNTLGKLIEKVISKRLQVHIIISNFIHLCQLGDIKQHLTIYIKVFITYLI